MNPSNRYAKTAMTVEKALGLLDYFDELNSEWGLSALARRASLSKATTYRFLSSLEKVNFVELDPLTKKYRLGFKLLDLGHRVTERLKLREVALPYMERLRDKTQETVHLTAEVNEEGIYFEKVESFSSVRLSTRIGARSPLHAGASFKVLMAYLPADRIDKLIRKGLPKITKNTVTDEDMLRKELQNIRQRGYAASQGELYHGFGAVAAPIRDAEGRVVVGVSVIAPAARLTQERIKEIAPLVKETAREISLRLGWKGEAR